jgi:alanyl-tRNA synthetase
VGYDHLETHARVIGLLVDHQLVNRIDPGMRAELVLDETPFYAETGGQVGDQGALYSETRQKLADVQTTYPAIPGLSVHRIVAHAPISTGDEVWALVDDPVHQATMRNHTATHLLHAALRKVLGPHVKQAGSVVAPDRLRFDFTHYTAMDRAEIQEVERLMNHEVLENIPVDTEIMPLDVAVSTGAMALFGEKYGDRVRVVSIPDFSKELCGGTHVARTGDIGMCKVVYESSFSAGVRRIEAITGERAVEQFQHSTDALNRLSQMMKVSEPELVEQVEKMLARERSLEKQIGQLKDKVAQSAGDDLESQARTLKDVKVLAAQVDGMDRQQLRALADSFRNKWKSAVVVLASAEDSNVSIISAVTKDLTAKVHAGKLVGTVAQAVGGKGGGRPDMAEGGGKDPSALRKALEQVYADVESKL